MPPKTLPTSCPMCGENIEHGSVSVHGTGIGFLFVGMSYQNCYFQPSGKKEQVVLGSRGQKAGFRCCVCDFVGMYGSESSL